MLLINFIGGEGILYSYGHLHSNSPDHYFDIFGSPKSIDSNWYIVWTAVLVARSTVVTEPNQLVTAGIAMYELPAPVGFVTKTFMK